MDLSDRIEAFARLGDYLKDSLAGEGNIGDPGLAEAVAEAGKSNPWFTPSFIHYALSETSRILDRSLLGEWTGRYSPEGLHPENPATVGTILAGNIPFVGFHDFLSILIAGHRFKGKLSGKDDRLLPFLSEKLLQIEAGFDGFIRFEESYIGTMDAIIATGSNNSTRYFEYYFGRYPHIFRSNRNGIAFISGNESAGELSSLADDVFLYFGMGCRNVSKLYVPEGYSFDTLYQEMEKYSHLFDHHKYANNYLYQRTVFLMNRVDHLDNGFLLIRQDPSIASAIGTLHYERYSKPEDIGSVIDLGRETIQCIATGKDQLRHSGVTVSGDIPVVPFGKTQCPELWDYADNVDTLKFLSNL